MNYEKHIHKVISYLFIGIAAVQAIGVWDILLGGAEMTGAVLGHDFQDALTGQHGAHFTDENGVERFVVTYNPNHVYAQGKVAGLLFLGSYGTLMIAARHGNLANRAVAKAK